MPLELTENHCQLIEEPDRDVYIFPILCGRDYGWLLHYGAEGRDSLYDYLYRCLYFHKPKIRSFDRSRVRSLEVKELPDRMIEEVGVPAQVVILTVDLDPRSGNGTKKKLEGHSRIIKPR